MKLGLILKVIAIARFTGSEKLSLEFSLPLLGVVA